MARPLAGSIPFDEINRNIVACDACPRLRNWCRSVATVKRKSFATDDYWGLPVPNFGDPDATGLIVGLAPAAHGANRTGRMFTGDRSGDWLYKAMHQVGLANQPTSSEREDGLILHRVLITAVCHCAPPDNKPTPDEIANCATFLRQTYSIRAFKAILCLGSISWNTVHKQLGIRPIPAFAHSAAHHTDGHPAILASYHPSQQNTFTGRLTMDMLVSVLSEFAKLIRD